MTKIWVTGKFKRGDSNTKESIFKDSVSLVSLETKRRAREAESGREKGKTGCGLTWCAQQTGSSLFRGCEHRGHTWSHSCSGKIVLLTEWKKTGIRVRLDAWSIFKRLIHVNCCYWWGSFTLATGSDLSCLSCRGTEWPQPSSRFQAVGVRGRQHRREWSKFSLISFKGGLVITQVSETLGKCF